MKNIFLIFLFCVAINQNSLSQKTDSLRYVYNNQTIYRYGSYFLKGSDRLSFRDLQAEFSMSDIGLVSYNKAKKYKTISNVLRYLSMFSVIGAAAYINSNNRNAVYAFIGGQFILLLGSSRYYTLSAQSLDRALWQRNKDVLFPGR